MEYAPLRLSMPSLLAKQLLKFRTRLIAGNKGSLSIHAKILYFNAFSLSLFYYVQTHRYFSKPLLKPLYKALSEFLLKRHWLPQLKLVGLRRWLRLGPLLDPAIMRAVSLFGCYLRQGHHTLPSTIKGTEESYTRQVHSCWKYWQHQLARDETRQLVNILNQPHDPSQAARRFQERFKQLAIAREVESAVSRLSSRIFHNGWAFGPSFDFLRWLSQMPISQVGAVPRFAVLRWALGEDPDLWLPLRRRVSRNSPCAWCAQSARTYPFGPHKGALCVSCIGPDASELVELPPEAQAFLKHHALRVLLGRLLPHLSEKWLEEPAAPGTQVQKGIRRRWKQAPPDCTSAPPTEVEPRETNKSSTHKRQLATEGPATPAETWRGTGTATATKHSAVKSKAEDRREPRKHT